MQKVYDKNIWSRAAYVMRRCDHFTNCNVGNITKSEIDYWLGHDHEHLIVSGVGGCVLLKDGTFHRVLFMKYGDNGYMIVYSKKHTAARLGGHDRAKYNIDYLVKFDNTDEGNKVWKTILNSNTDGARTKYGAKLYRYELPVA